MKDKKIIILLTIIIFLLLLSPIVFKTGFSDKVFTAEETYLNLIKINQAKQEFNLHEQITNHNPFHILLSNIPLSDVNLVLIIPLMLGILTILLIFLILQEFNLSDNETMLSLLLFSLTPIFLYKFTTLNHDNLAFPLLLLTMLLFIKKSYLTIIPLIITILINPILGVIFLLYLITNVILKKKIYLTMITTAVAFFTFTIYFLINKTINIQIQKMILDDVLIELGSMIGYSIPVIILGVMGLFVWWEKGTERTIITTSLIIGLFFSLMLPDIRLIIALLLSIFAGIGMNQLLKKDWELKKIKQMAIMLIFYIILFSAILTINTQLTQISKQEVEAAKFLTSIRTDNQVLSTENKGFMIQYLSKKQTFLDGNSYLETNYEEKKEIANQIFYARRLSELEQLLKNNSIEYIFIHEEMKNGGIWVGREEGLQFFLLQRNHFIKIFDNKQVQIYKYIEN